MKYTRVCIAISVCNSIFAKSSILYSAAIFIDFQIEIGKFDENRECAEKSFVCKIHELTFYDGQAAQYYSNTRGQRLVEFLCFDSGTEFQHDLRTHFRQSSIFIDFRRFSSKFVKIDKNRRSKNKKNIRLEKSLKSLTIITAVTQQPPLTIDLHVVTHTTSPISQPFPAWIISIPRFIDFHRFSSIFVDFHRFS